VTPVALTTGETVLSLIGLAVGLPVLILVIALFTRFMHALLEIKGYAGDILEHGVAIARNVDGIDGLVRTRELGGALPGLAGAYLNRLKGPQP